MAGSGGFSVRVAAVDQATPVLDKINRRIAALTAPAQRTQKSLEKFGEVTGISRLTQGMGGLAHNALDAFRSVDRIASPLAAITGAASIAGMTALVNRWAELGNQVSQTSYCLNMGAGRLTNFEGAARLAGVEAGTLDAGLEGLGRTLTDATFGRNPEAVRTFNQLGIAFKDANGHARQAADVLPEIADALKRFPDARTQGRVLDLTGVGAGLLAMLKDGRQGLDDLRKRAGALGGGMTDEMAEHARKARAAFEGLSEAIEGVANRLADQASGPITKWMDKTSDWIARNQDAADSIAKIGLALTGLMALKPAGWVLRLLGLGAVPALASRLSPWGAFISTLWPGSANDGEDDELKKRGLGTKGMPQGGEDGGTAPPDPFTTWWQRHAPTWLGGGDTPPPSFEDHDAYRTRAGGRGRSRMADIGALVAYFEGQGWTKEQTAGILANFQGESGMDLGNVGDNGAARGLGQWRDGRRAQYIRMFGHDPTEGSTLEQAEFTQWELTHTEKAAGDRLRNARGAREAAAIVSTDYERPRERLGEEMKRAGYADDWMRRMDAPAAPAPSSGNVHVEVTLRGAPPGTVASVATRGPVSASPPRIETSMAGSR